MNDKPRLLQELNRLKRGERAIKVEELRIRETQPARDHYASLLLNRQKSMKNKRQQAHISAELRSLSSPATRIVGQGVTPVPDAGPLLLPACAAPPPVDGLRTAGSPHTTLLASGLVGQS
jgi:hypothetical protein